MAFCATLAKTALRSSWKRVAPIRVAPSSQVSNREYLRFFFSFRVNGEAHTGNDHGPCNSIGSSTHGSKVHIHRIHNALEVERNFDIEDLGLSAYIKYRCIDIEYEAYLGADKQ